MERTEYEILTTVEAQHWWHGGMRATAAALLNWFYAYRHDLRILDAGCGVGGTMRFLQHYGTVIGLDLAPDAIELSPPELSPRLMRGSVVHLPFADASFDLVTSFDVLYHRGVADEGAAVREFHRVLDAGGRLLLRLPAYEFLRSKHDRAVHTRRRYTTGAVRALLQENGFLVERCSYVNTLLFPLALAQRLLERALPALEQQQSDLALPHPVLNTTLRLPMALEAAWLSLGGSLPYGLSVLCLAHCRKTQRVYPLSFRTQKHDPTPRPDQ
jgi:SAM-dependent methyltransferase